MPLATKTLPKKLVVDDRSISWNNRNNSNAVQQLLCNEFSKIPKDTKVQLAARYLRSHCHSCYCREVLKAPTLKCLNDSSSDCDDDGSCTCLPLPRISQRQITADSDSQRDGSAKHFNAKSCVRDNAGGAGDWNCRNNYLLNGLQTTRQNNGYYDKRDIDYTKQRKTYENHRNPRREANVSMMDGEDSVDEKHIESHETELYTYNLADVSDFRNEHYFDTHDPFNTTRTTSAAPKLDDTRWSAGQQHKCVHTFQLNERWQPQPLNPDVYGRSCCDVCSQPMTSGRRTPAVSVGDGGGSVSARSGGGKKETSAKSSCTPSGWTSNVATMTPCTDFVLEQQQIHIGRGDDCIQLKVPKYLLEGCVSSARSPTSGAGAPGSGKKTRATQIAPQGRREFCYCPNSYALKQQKYVR